MRGFRNRFRSQDGVSILYGLLFMLVAVMVCAVIISASTTAAQRVHADKVRTQGMLTLQSAGNMVKKYFDDATFNVTIVRDEDGKVLSVNAELPDDTFGKIVGNAINEKAGTSEENVPVSVDTHGTAPDLDNATVTLGNCSVKRDVLPDGTGMDFALEAELELQPNDDRTQASKLYLAGTAHVSYASYPETAVDNTKVVVAPIKWDKSNGAGGVSISTSGSKSGGAS